MEMTARLTGDAKISTLKNDKQVVNFNVVINDSYKAKGSNEPSYPTTIFPSITMPLTKGTLVELQGRVGVNAYIGKEGEAKATLTFHVNTIKLHRSAGVKIETTVKTNAEAVAVAADDLPF